MHAGEQVQGLLAASSGRPLAPPVVNVAELLHSDVAHPPVGDDSRPRFHVVGHEGVERGTRGIGDRGHAAAAHAPGFVDLDCDAG